MKLSTAIPQLALILFILAMPFKSIGHEIIFCGEKIPLSDRFVAEKLMNIIKKQINYNVVSQLKKKGNKEMQTIERYLDLTNLPEDFKYLAIVESGLRNVISSAGAGGFWQLMPKTAREWGLQVNEEMDERTNIDLSTHAACKVLAQYYLEIRKKFKLSSWVLTAAAYNVGIGNISKAIKEQGKNYFEMNLNKETAEYVYKIIAVKELFEYPELYMKNFEYNVFNIGNASKKSAWKETDIKTDPEFTEMSVKVNTDDGNHLDNPSSKTSISKKDTKKLKPEKNSNIKSEKFVWAHITGNYKNFKDKDEIRITLDGDLEIENSFKGKGINLTGTGWKVDDKVFIDFGYGKKLIVIDFNNNKHDGVLISSLKDKEEIYLKVTEYRN